MPREYWTRADLARFINDHRSTIMHQWEVAVRKGFLQGELQGRIALRNNLETLFLQRLVESVEAGKVADMHQLSEHGLVRSMVLTYSLDQVISEFSVFRHTIFEVIEASAPLENDLRDLILATIDAGMRVAAAAYSGDRQWREMRRRRIVEDERDRLKSAAAQLEEELHVLKRLSHQLQSDYEELNSQVKSLRSNEETDHHRIASLQDLSNQRETFLSSLAHDLRTPLSIIKMAIDLVILQVPTDPNLIDLTNVIMRNLFRTEAMLRDFLDTQRLRAGYVLEINPEACNLADIIGTTLEDLSSEYHQRFVFPRAEVVNGLWDRSYLQRMLENLLINAVKYGEKDQPIEIRLTQDKGWASVTVHNFGEPIASSVQESLCQEFYRAPAATSKGWGLGLTMVRGVVKAHGGTLRVTSNKTEGTAFTVMLPIRRLELPAGKTPTPIDQARSETAEQ